MTRLISATEILLPVAMVLLAIQALPVGPLPISIEMVMKAANKISSALIRLEFLCMNFCNSSMGDEYPINENHEFTYPQQLALQSSSVRMIRHGFKSENFLA